MCEDTVCLVGEKISRKTKTNFPVILVFEQVMVWTHGWIMKIVSLWGLKKAQ